MQDTLKLDISKHEMGQQTEDFWQNRQHEAKKTQQAENEAFAAQIEKYEAWQAAIWLD